MVHRKAWDRWALCVALGVALALPLAACHAKDKQDQTQGETQEQPVASDSGASADADGAESTADATDAAAESPEVLDAPAQQEPEAPAAPQAQTVQTGAFSFVIPAYWDGRVEWEDTGTADSPSVMVYLKGDPDAWLASVTYCAGTDAEVAGDIGTHLVGSVSDGTNHVEVWANNWPWIAANSAEMGYDAGVSSDEMAELVDLSTGGGLTLQDALENGADAVAMVESSYMADALASTVAFG